jgi:sporulation protein YlmC with PRC-barrel domain
MRNKKNRIAFCAALAALALPLYAADNSPQSSSSQQNEQNNQYNSSSSQSGQSAQSTRQQRLAKDCSIGKFIGADAKSKDNQDLGNVEDVLINPQTGKVDFVVLGQSGVTGSGEDHIPVPWQAVNLRSDGTLAVNKNKSDLKSAPSLNKSYSNLDEPATVTIYEFYEVPAPSSMGGGESPGGQSQGNANSGSNNGGNVHTNSNL